MNRWGADRLARLDPFGGLGLAIAIKLGDSFANEIAYDWLADKGEDVEPVFEIGQCYFIKTVSDYYVGRLERLTHDWMVLSDASWIPDTGRFNEFLRTGRPQECEPMAHGAVISIGAITAISPWPFAPLGGVI